MNIDACFQLGYITGTRGLGGEVTGVLDTDNPGNYKNLESVFVLKKTGQVLVPFFVQSIHIREEKVRLKFEDINSKNEAKALVGSGLFLPLEQLPTLEGQDYYYHELVNWRVYDTSLGELGKVIAVNLQSPQPLMVMDYQDKEVLIPVNDQIVRGIDRELGRVNVSLPEGLLDVYLED